MKENNVGVAGGGWAAAAHTSAIGAATLGQAAAVCSARKPDAAEPSAKYDRPIRAYNDLQEE